MLSLIQLLDDEKCFAVVRELRWPGGVNCPHCHAPHVVKQGRDDTQRFRNGRGWAAGHSSTRHARGGRP
ncbi:transposase [Deinococcus arenicola]|uniref:transposase n=1 Tax=Deinococcus arenicola TaxID=2994950 RepID=UPI003D678D9F